jgi:AcrR family transcriptional regulator
MAIPSQDGAPESGRVNQKRRTRLAIVAAARELLAEGVVPTVAQAAEAAFVGRTTAYRYFPTQESLLIEVSVTADVDELEALVSRPLDRDGAPERVLAVLDGFNRHVLADELGYRTALRLYLDLWLAAAATAETAPIVREGRRRRWLEQSLAPLRDAVPDAQLERLAAALSVLSGAEAIVVLRDIYHLEPDEALAVTRWAARALVEATLGARTST